MTLLWKVQLRKCSRFNEYWDFYLRLRLIIAYRIFWFSIDYSPWADIKSVSQKTLESIYTRYLKWIAIDIGNCTRCRTVFSIGFLSVKINGWAINLQLTHVGQQYKYLTQRISYLKLENRHYIVRYFNFKHACYVRNFSQYHNVP